MQGFCKKSLRKNETDLEKKWAKSVQLVRVSFLRSDFLQNPYFKFNWVWVLLKCVFFRSKNLPNAWFSFVIKSTHVHVWSGVVFMLHYANRMPDIGKVLNRIMKKFVLFFSSFFLALRPTGYRRWAWYTAMVVYREDRQRYPIWIITPALVGLVFIPFAKLFNLELL